MPARRVSANDPVLPPVLTVTPQGIEIRNPASGWLLAACVGLAAVAYATVAVSVWPPSLNFETPNPNIPFAKLNLEVVTESRALAGPGVRG